MLCDSDGKREGAIVTVIISGGMNLTSTLKGGWDTGFGMDGEGDSGNVQYHGNVQYRRNFQMWNQEN